MRESEEQHLFRVIRKHARYASRGVVTALEFKIKVFDEFAHTKQVYPDAVPQLGSAIPDSVRGEFLAAIRDAIQPDFRMFYIGAERPLTDKEMRLEEDLCTARVQDWAKAIVKFLDSS